MTTAQSIKLSSSTIDILKNFSSINSNILVKTGNKLTTISPVKNVMATAIVPESFDTEFGIWDLNKFLGTVSLFDGAEFSFEDNHVVISGGNGSSVKYWYSEPKLLTTVNKEIKMPESVVNFTLKHSDFKELLKASAVLQLPDMALRTDGDSMELIVMDKKDKTSNTYSINLGPIDDNHEFCFYFKVENLKMLPGDYTVNVSEKSVSQFTHTKADLNYWIALEPDSTYKS